MRELKEILIKEFNVKEEKVDKVISCLPEVYKTGELSLGELRTYISTILSQFEDCVSKTYIEDKYFDPNYFYEDEQGRLIFKKDAPEGKVPQPIGYTDYSSMFSSCSSGKSYDISKWDISNVTNMECMFLSCKV